MKWPWRRYESDDPPAHEFCRECGAEMVDGYLVVEDYFHRGTGEPMRAIQRGLLCTSQNGRGSKYKWWRKDAANDRHDGVRDVAQSQRIGVPR